jgi:hypothetical protein
MSSSTEIGQQAEHVLRSAILASIESQLQSQSPIQQGSSVTCKQFEIGATPALLGRMNSTATVLIPSVSVLVNSVDVESEFRELTKQWKSERTSTSFASDIAMLPSYQKIIGLGKDALPLILAELDRELDHWFWALSMISREDPVPPESHGKMREMAMYWRIWGRKKGYVR